MKKQPKHCMILKIVWFTCLILSIIGLICTFLFAANVISRGMPLGIVGLSALIVVVCPSVYKQAFAPERAKMKAERELYIQSITKDMQEEYLSTDADINHRSIKKRTRSVKQGLMNEQCPNCGDKVDANENFCNKCGEAIYKACKKCKSINESTDDFCRSCGNKLK